MAPPSIASSDEDPFELEKYLELPKKRTPSLRSTSSEDPFGLEKYVKPPSIMDRKIETRGLGTSFSSNIGRRLRVPKTPTRTNRANKDSDDSRKKVIYNWLEKTKDSPPSKSFQTPKRDRPQTPTTMSTGRSKSEYDRESIRTYETPINKSFAGFPESPLPNTPTAPESYELELLNYKQFFNNRPLVRCLDENQPEGEFFQRERPALPTKSADDIAPIDSASQGQQDASEKVLDKTVETVDESGEAYSESEYSEELGGKRDPEEVCNFWDNVRLQLWISEEELDSIGEDKEPEEQEEKEVSVPSSPAPITPITPQTDLPKTPPPTSWVMMGAPTKWSYTSSIDRGNIYLGEHYPLSPDALSRPRSLDGTDTEEKIKVVEGHVSESDEGWAAHQRQEWQKKNSISGEYFNYYKDHKQTKEKMASFDEFLLTISPKQSLYRTRSRRPTF